MPDSNIYFVQRSSERG